MKDFAIRRCVDHLDEKKVSPIAILDSCSTRIQWKRLICISFEASSKSIELCSDRVGTEVDIETRKAMAAMFQGRTCLQLRIRPEPVSDIRA